jgi:uncharacterized repeat protein (TIGR03803 family)
VAGCPDGYIPSGTLIELPNGRYYGSTAGGGKDGIGTVFDVTSSGKLTTIYNFGSQPNDGVNPYSGVVAARDGNLYGTTSNGGTLGYGTLYRLALDGVKTTIVNFGPAGNPIAPEYSLVQGRDGNLYGVTGYGGSSNNGAVFKATPDGKLKLLYSFCGQPHCADGAEPAGIIQGKDGSLYGTTSVGGAYRKGTVFQVKRTGTLTTLYSFCSVVGCGDGWLPITPVIQATDGNFYGTTFFGGEHNLGTIFEITPTGSLSTLHSFDGTDGSGPWGLVQDTDGNLYGTTGSGLHIWRESGHWLFVCDVKGQGKRWLRASGQALEQASSEGSLSSEDELESTLRG